jgi:hypothetical protein
MDVLARIALRYGAGFLMAKGFLTTDMGNALAADPDVLSWIQLAIGAASVAVIEGWYWVAKKMGWRT